MARKRAQVLCWELPPIFCYASCLSSLHLAPQLMKVQESKTKFETALHVAIIQFNTRLRPLHVYTPNATKAIDSHSRLKDNNSFSGWCDPFLLNKLAKTRRKPWYVSTARNQLWIIRRMSAANDTHWGAVSMRCHIGFVGNKSTRGFKMWLQKQNA